MGTTVAVAKPFLFAGQAKGLRGTWRFADIAAMLRIRILGLCLGAVLASSSAGAGEVYRWVDENGVHYGNRPVDGATLLFRTEDRPPPPRSNRESVSIARIIDGDTVQLMNGQRLRLAGINAPEVAVAGKPGQSGGQDAKARLQELLIGQRGLSVEPAVETVDRYGRLLGYLFDADGRDVAATMLAEGLVFAVPYPPNVVHADAYMKAEAPARDGRIGLWVLPEFQIHAPASLADAGNQFRRVRFAVATVARDGGDEVLRDHDGFEARIPQEAAGGFPAMSQLLGRTLVLRGYLRSLRGRVYLSLVHPSQIESETPSGE